MTSDGKNFCSLQKQQKKGNGHTAYEFLRIRTVCLTNLIASESSTVPGSEQVVNWCLLFP